MKSILQYPLKLYLTTLLIPRGCTSLGVKTIQDRAYLFVACYQSMNTLDVEERVFQMVPSNTEFDYSDRNYIDTVILHDEHTGDNSFHVFEKY